MGVESCCRNKNIGPVGWGSSWSKQDASQLASNVDSNRLRLQSYKKEKNGRLNHSAASLCLAIRTLCTMDFGVFKSCRLAFLWLGIIKLGAAQVYDPDFLSVASLVVDKIEDFGNDGNLALQIVRLAFHDAMGGVDALLNLEDEGKHRAQKVMDFNYFLD